MDLTRLFHPSSIAIVGASPKMWSSGKLPFYQFLKMAGYPGDLHLVNPGHREIDGKPVYSSLSEVPAEVDLVIASVPARAALSVTRDAAAKGVPFLHFFTSGFSEVGNRELEEQLLSAARKGGTRIVGPNCLGAMCVESKVTFTPAVAQAMPGGAAFLGQSGGVTSNFVRAAMAKRIGLNKVVSYGNQIDLRIEDYLDYFAEDDGVTVIGVYLEDVKDGRAFLDALERVRGVKPVVALKGGSTEQGARAAMSHTGALAGSAEIFAAAIRQKGAVMVDTPEQLVDAIMLLGSDNPPRGGRIGFMGAGGGTSVLFADMAARAGLSLPLLGPETRAKIAEKIPDVNTSTANPVDLGAFGFDNAIMSHTMRSMDPDDNVDLIVPYFAVDFLSLFPDDMLDEGLRTFAGAARSINKPVVPVVFKTSEDNRRHEDIRLKALEVFRENGLPVFNYIQDAAAAIAASCAWKPQGRE